jgi:hypothetical protein
LATEGHSLSASSKGLNVISCGGCRVLASTRTIPSQEGTEQKKVEANHHRASAQGALLDRHWVDQYRAGA